MSDSFQQRWPDRRPPVREPIFNIAPAVVGLAVLLLAIHLVRVWLMSQYPDADDWIIGAFAFIPARELASAADLVGFPGGGLARFWSPLTYAFLHADWTHVGLNDVAMVAFGSPLAWRLGAPRFLVFSALGAIAGALLHFAFYSHDIGPVVGASAAISAQMAGVSCFAFANGGAMFGGRGAAAYRMPAPPLAQTLRNPQVLIFLGAWFATNLIFGLVGTGLSSGPIAWDAHLGGFAAGLLLFRLFDPVR
jgi:membrane associated rhomboid family serine protease